MVLESNIKHITLPLLLPPFYALSLSPPQPFNIQNEKKYDIELEKRKIHADEYISGSGQERIQRRFAASKSYEMRKFS